VGYLCKRRSQQEYAHPWGGIPPKPTEQRFSHATLRNQATIPYAHNFRHHQ